MAADVVIDWHQGDRGEVRPLFELAEDSPQQLDAYLPLGGVLVARDENETVGHLQLVETGAPDERELRSMAVLPDHRRRGIGRALIERAVAECGAQGVRTLLVATATADVGNLRFYQRAGFRMLRIERDVFTPAAGYPQDLNVDGIPLRDQVWLSRALTPGD